jgi:hypothetical protein
VVADGYRPDRFDITGALICVAGVAVIMYAHAAADTHELACVVTEGGKRKRVLDVICPQADLDGKTGPAVPGQAVPGRTRPVS